MGDHHPRHREDLESDRKDKRVEEWTPMKDRTKTETNARRSGETGRKKEKRRRTDTKEDRKKEKKERKDTRKQKKRAKKKGTEESLIE